MDRVLRDTVRRSMSVAHPRSFPKFISASEVRKTFLDFFCVGNNHLYIRSSPVFSLKDPTLAFTNAGMNQFKDVFLGLVRPASRRVANFQKCIRVGGLHDDTSKVGQDGCHHTFFEMLGNWSFGDYFKEEACRMSWNLLTEVYGIPSERLYITYFGGDEALGLSEDAEVREIWRQIGVKDTHILPFGAEDNFWAGSLTGPCGPCTEIHYDHVPGRTDAGNLVNSGSDEVTELWSVVFNQYNRQMSGELTDLNDRFVDTGMGLERLIAVLQGKTSNYDTDLFLPLFEVIRKHTGHSGYTGSYDGNATDCDYRVLADHSRMITVALSDGMIPNHQSKVRKTIRKALTVAEQTFNSGASLLKELSCHVAEILSEAYPETGRNLAKIHYIIETEEEIMKSNEKNILSRWKEIKNLFPTLSDADILEAPEIVGGLGYVSKNILKKRKDVVSPEDAFTLFETLGVPISTTQKFASKLGLHFDMEAYLKYESSRKSDSKNYLHTKFLKDRVMDSHWNIMNKLMERKTPPTSDYFKYDYRVKDTDEYVFKDQETTIQAIVRGDELLDVISAADIGDSNEDLYDLGKRTGKRIKTPALKAFILLPDNAEVGLVLDRTQLLSEDGGEESDHGTLEIEKKIIFNITKVVKVKDYVIHFGHFKHFPSEAKVTIDSIGLLKFDEARRLALMRSHTALHILNAAIREEIFITGERSSTVAPDNLELKYMVYQKNVEDFEKVENFVRDFIRHGTSVNRKILNHEQFQSLSDVVYIPGETIVEREIPVIEINSGFRLSREYCKGAHVVNTSHLKDFVIMKFVKGSYKMTTIGAVTGEKCLEVRRADAEMEKRWAALKAEIDRSKLLQPSEVKNFLFKVDEMYSEVDNSDKLSYKTRTSLKSAVAEAKKNLTPFVNMAVRKFLQEEIRKASEESSDMFVVHFVDSWWEFNPKDLEDAAECFQDRAIFMLFKQKDSVAIQCVIPANNVTNNFSAQTWLTETLLPVAPLRKGGGSKNPNSSKLTYYTMSQKIPEDKIRLIINNAVKLAKQNVENFNLM